MKFYFTLLKIIKFFKTTRVFSKPMHQSCCTICCLLFLKFLPSTWLLFHHIVKQNYLIFERSKHDELSMWQLNSTNVNDAHYIRNNVTYLTIFEILFKRGKSIVNDRDQQILLCVFLWSRIQEEYLLIKNNILKYSWASISTTWFCGNAKSLILS